jgi:hypothetical protein
MRRLTFTLLFITSGAIVSNAQLTNGDLETWTNNQWSTVPTGSGNTYKEPGSGTNRANHFLRTINAVNDLPSPLTVPLSCWQSDTAHGGSFSARVKSQQFTTYFIPGFIGTGDIDIAAQTLHLGRQYTAHPDTFSAWYLYAPVNGDSAKFEVIFTLYDALNQVSNVIGHGSKTILNATSGTNWANAKFGITWTSASAPDTVKIIAASSGGYNLSNFLSSLGQVGSQLWVDDMMLYSGNLGVETPDYANNNVSIYPNPASDFVNITTTNLPANLNMYVYDIHGKQIMARVITDANYLLDISSLANGVYGVVIMDDASIIHRSKFIKK